MQCKRKFITELSYSEEFKREAIQISYKGNSGRAVGRIMGINKLTVYNWIKKMNIFVIAYNILASLSSIFFILNLQLDLLPFCPIFNSHCFSDKKPNNQGTCNKYLPIEWWYYIFG